jgi:hypothetical protein
MCILTYYKIHDVPSKQNKIDNKQGLVNRLFSNAGRNVEIWYNIKKNRAIVQAVIRRPLIADSQV